MKKIIITAMVLLLSQIGYSQSWSEWFSQKKTQKKYLLEQIVALQAYIKVAKDGYNIADKGLNTISSIKNGEFDLHHFLFNSFKNVNPAIRKNPRAGEIISLQGKISSQYRKDLQVIESADQFSDEDLAYIKRVYGRLFENCDHVLEDLNTVLTDAALEMKDDERLKRLNELYEQMHQNYAFGKSFGQQVIIMARQKRQESIEAARSKVWYNIK
ncbi:MAG TPA: hypothetical protein VN040_14155 [Pseudosphingobacterium sp.]|nr:hypothetical protein [Pseudosphingobacterium sp.]